LVYHTEQHSARISCRCCSSCFYSPAEIQLCSKYISQQGSLLDISRVKTFHFEISKYAQNLTELLALAQFLKGVPSEALGAGVQLALFPTHDVVGMKYFMQE